MAERKTVVVESRVDPSDLAVAALYYNKVGVQVKSKSMLVSMIARDFATSVLSCTDVERPLTAVESMVLLSDIGVHLNRRMVEPLPVADIPLSVDAADVSAALEAMKGLDSGEGKKE
ncbi:hypothetical protein LCGC14_2730590 [marine sediment metagenome]|uniref:Uncharacterized protein n=1 Tax=marine sediment metagenome TaxID=412755 RepID=A0A0F9BGE4_9ZZZZ